MTTKLFRHRLECLDWEAHSEKRQPNSRWRVGHQLWPHDYCLHRQPQRRLVGGLHDGDETHAGGTIAPALAVVPAPTMLSRWQTRYYGSEYERLRRLAARVTSTSRVR